MPEKLKNGKYKGRVKLKGHPQKSKSPFNTWNEAKDWELQTVKKIKNPLPKKEDLTWEDVSELWLKNCLKHNKPKTCGGKAAIMDAAIEFWGYNPQMTDLSTLLIEQFLDSKPGKTANRYKREINTFLMWAVDRGLADEIYTAKIKPYKERPYKRYVPPAEDIETAKAYADPLARDIITVIYNTAARAGEVRKLRWEDVDLDRKEITLWTGKRDASDRKDDTLEMTDTLHELLTRLSQKKTHKKYVFSKDGKPLEAWWVNEIMTTIHNRAKKGGCEFEYFSLHCIRHHVAALLAYRLSLIEISKILRHRNVSTTDIYLRSLVTIKTKGIKVLDDIQKSDKADVISFQEAANKRGGI